MVAIDSTWADTVLNGFLILILAGVVIILGFLVGEMILAYHRKKALQENRITEARRHNLYTRFITPNSTVEQLYEQLTYVNKLLKEYKTERLTRAEELYLDDLIWVAEQANKELRVAEAARHRTDRRGRLA